jgi:hypothetical protein
LADFLGAQGQRRLLELQVSSSEISAYALYSQGTISRVLLINHEAHIGANTARSNVTVFLKVSREISSNVAVKRLRIPSADAKTGLSWGGITYETRDGRPAGSDETMRHDVKDGIVVQATEAVMVTLRRSRYRGGCTRGEIL